KDGVRRIYQTTELTLTTISKLSAGEFRQLANDNNSDDDDDTEDESFQDVAVKEVSQNNDDSENGSFQNAVSQDTTQQVLITLDNNQICFHTEDINYQQHQDYCITEFSNVDQQIRNITNDFPIYATISEQTQSATNTNIFQNTIVPHYHHYSSPY
ncbi:15218_t:CDS:1, partial [Cetraspora pellucida]